MNVINILDLADTETALVLTTDRMCRVAEKPLTQDTRKELRGFAHKVIELVEAE